MKPSLNLLERNKPYLVAVSFGPDSMALLHSLITQGFSLRVAHVNYHKRAESDFEQDNLIQYCFTHDIPIDVLDVRRKITGNFQHEARRIRYDFFLQLAEKYRLSAVLTAHHQDDDLETALMQIQRQGLYPYYGILEKGQWQNLTIIRPLLQQTKQALLAYCGEHQVPYALDASNESQLYARNRIRKTLKQKTTKELATLRQKVANLNGRIAEDRRKIRPWIGKISIPLSHYLQWNAQTQFLYWHAQSEHFRFFFPITRAFLSKVSRIRSVHKTHLRISLTSPWVIEKSEDTLYVLSLEWLKSYQFNAVKNTTKDFPLIHFAFQHYHHSSFPLRCRSVVPLDQVKIKDYQKTFRRLAIDWKMPLYLRQIWPAIQTKQSSTLFIPRYQKNLADQAKNWLRLTE